MSFRALWLAVPLLACEPAPAAPAPEPVDACAATSPVRVAAPPAGWRPDATTNYKVHDLGDRLVYSFDSPNLPVRTYWQLDRCGGAPEPLPSLSALDVAALWTIDGENGRVLYARDADDTTFVVDRLDVPGDDVPRPIAGLPAGFIVRPRNKYVLFDSIYNPLGVTHFPAAGLGSDHYVFYAHAGDPERPAVFLGDDIVDYAFFGGRLLLLHESGDLRDTDPLTGLGEPLLTGVRYFVLSFDDRRLIWQAQGDDLAEPVHLLDLETGEQRQISVNDFTALSWGRFPGEPVAVGTWQFTRDSGAAVMFGPDDRLVAAVRTDTGESLPIPAHVGWQVMTGDDMLILVLPDPAQRVEAVWTVRTGDARVYYRGPGDPKIRHNDGARLEYFLPSANDPEFGPLYRVDLATGSTVRLAPRVPDPPVRLDDRRYLLHTRASGIPTLEGTYFSHDLDLFDADTQAYYPIAEGIDDWVHEPDLGVYYLDARGAEPGLWLYPLPAE
jgi:hypothetical protein